MSTNPTLKKVLAGAIILGSAGLILSSIIRATQNKNGVVALWQPALTMLIAGSAIAYNVSEIKKIKEEDKIQVTVG
jgi:hypothetical protein